MNGRVGECTGLHIVHVNDDGEETNEQSPGSVTQDPELLFSIRALWISKRIRDLTGERNSSLILLTNSI